MPRPYKEENVSWGGFETRPYMRQFTPMNPASSPAVVIRDVSKSYMREERRLQVLTDCSFTIESNQFTVLLGPSGSGKTTLVRLIAGYERADAGEILCDGQPISRPGAERMVVFQETALFPWMTLLENVAYGPIQAGAKPAAAKASAADLLQKVGLAGFEQRYPSQLSGGMQRRAEVVRALINRPRLLLLDEPFRGLDHMTRGLMQEFLLRLFDEEKVTTFFVTSEVEEAVFLSDRIIVLSDVPGPVKAIVEVPLPRPRGFDLTVDQRYAAIKERVLDLVTSSQAA
jgi:NitT/TauT family transport system ATP-binding protein